MEGAGLLLHAAACAQIMGMLPRATDACGHKKSAAVGPEGLVERTSARVGAEDYFPPVWLTPREFLPQPCGNNLLVAGLEVDRIHGDLVEISPLLGTLLHIDVRPSSLQGLADGLA
jgi:hypothetical protein